MTLSFLVETGEGALDAIDKRLGQDESSLTLVVAVFIENVYTAAKEQVAYMVDMAKS